MDNPRTAPGSDTLDRWHRATGAEGEQVQLRPGLPVLWRGPTEVQLGTDPRWAVVLTDLSPSAALALRSATPGAPEHELRAAMGREHVPPAEADAILAHLRSAHLLVEAPARPHASPDAAAWSLVDPDGSGGRLMARRTDQVVRVVGLGRLGGSVATHLAAAGVGTVELEDDGRVTPADVGVGGLGARDVGAARVAATARLVHDCAATVRTAASRGNRAGRLDLVVLVEEDVADPLRYRQLLDDDVPHLSVVVREASVLVGPLVRPGRSACLRCVDLHRADLDPAWPVVASQLVGRQARRGVETTLAATGSALAVSQALAHLDGRPTALSSASLEIRLPDALPRRLSWPMHPACDCVGPPQRERTGAERAPGARVASTGTSRGQRTKAPAPGGAGAPEQAVVLSHAPST